VQNRLAFSIVLLVVTVGALAFRLPKLADRSMHADEAVQAARFRDLWQDGTYRYDPNEFHGPTLTYATLAAPWIAGPREGFAATNEATYRIVPVVFGTGLVMLLWLLSDGLGRWAAVCAGVLTAISPTMVFFSRYYIHETLFVFFTLAAMAAGWRYVCSRRLAWCLVAGGCLGLMQATKETSVIAFFSMGVGILLTWLSMGAPRKTSSPRLHETPENGRARLLPSRKNAPPAAQQELRPPKGTADLQLEKKPGQLRSTLVWHLALGSAVAVFVAVTLLSSFFTNLRGPLDGVLTYLPWLGRAGGASPHIHPFYHYLHILAYWQIGEGPVWSELFVLALATLGFVAAFLPGEAGLLRDANTPFVRWVGFYTIVLTAAYTCIPYKTPWCLLGFLHGMILLAGVGAVAVIRAVPTLPIKTCATIILLGGAGHLGWQSYCTSFVYHEDARNPYVYAHTLPDVQRLADDIEQWAEASPDGQDVLIKVIWHDGYYWPLPWYLRQYERVGYLTQLPEDPSAPIVVSSSELDEALTEHLDDTHLMTGFYGVRPNVLAQTWVRMDLWEAHLRRLGRYDAASEPVSKR